MSTKQRNAHQAHYIYGPVQQIITEMFIFVLYIIFKSDIREDIRMVKTFVAV